MNASQWLGLLIQSSIVLTVFGLGLTATWEDATYLLRRPRLLLRAVLSMYVVMPIIVAMMATLFAARFEVEVSVVAFSVSPVPPIIQTKQITAGGRGRYVVGLLVAMSLLSIVLVPCSVVILDLVFNRSGTISPEAVAKLMMTTVLAPLLAGLVVHQWIPKAAGASHAIIAVAGITLALAVVVLMYGLWPIIRSYIGNGLVLVLATLAVLGLMVGHLLGGPLAGDRTSLALATASRHPAVALAIATSGVLSNPKPELAILLLYLVVATVISIPYQKWRVRSAENITPGETRGTV
jgi:bile acid:Na+ symporter, BASS family